MSITYPQQLIHLKLVLTSRNNLALGKIDNKPQNCRHNSWKPPNIDQINESCYFYYSSCSFDWLYT